MERKKDYLFELIKSMTGPEKRYFKRNCKIHSEQRETVYEQIFDAIDAQAEYNEKLLTAQFKDYKLAEHFSRAKNHLQGTIMDSLRAFSKSNSVRQEINTMIANMQVLFDKNLFVHCKKEMNKAKKLILKNELFEYYGIIARFHAILAQSSEFKPSLLRDMKRQHEVDMKILENHDTIVHYRYLYLELYIKALMIGIVYDESGLEPLKTIIDNKYLNDESHAVTIHSKILLYLTKCEYYKIACDSNNYYKYTKMCVKGIVKNKYILKTYFNLYIKGLYEWLISCVRLKKLNEFNTVLSELKSVPLKWPEFCNVNTLDFIKFCLMNAHLYMLIKTRQYEAAIRFPLTTDVLNRVGIRTNLPVLYLQIFYYMAYANYKNAKYDEALRWLNRLINDSQSRFRTELYIFANVLKVFCYLEIGNPELLESSRRSLIRLMSKRKNLLKFEKALLSFLRHQSRYDGDFNNKKDLLTLKSELIKLKNNPFEQNALDYFDFIGWIDNKQAA